MDQLRRHLSRTAVRTAAPIAAVSAILSTAHTAILLQAGWIIPAVSGIGTGLVMFAASYGVMHVMHYRRLGLLDRITQDIYRKQFGEYKPGTMRHRDEIDHLIRQCIRASETVEREIARLNKIENYRKDFIGDVSHELKTPIFAIQGFIETLLNGAMEDPDVNRLFLEKAMGNVNRLIDLIRDLMDISRLESGELKSMFVTFRLRDLLDEVVEHLREKSSKETVEVKIQGFDQHLAVVADRNQMRQVLVNLIENAIKYNRKDGWVEVGLRPFPKKHDKVLLYVRDNGVGIEPKDLSRVTERFFRADKSRSRDKGGTGLGLSIVKHIIQAHGENLYIESEPGKGSTFSITLAREGGVALA